MNTEPAASSDDLADQIAGLVRTLQETERRLQELTQGQVDAVVLPAGRSYLLGEAQERLRQSEENFRQLADNITDVFWIRSPDMKMVHYISPAFERVWRRPVEQLYSDPAKWIDYVFPEDRQHVQDNFAKLVSEAPAIDIEYRILWPGGEVRWVRSRGFKVRNSSGQVIRLAGIVTDITERRKAHEQLKLLETCVEHLTDLVIITEADLLEEPGPRIVFVNEAFVSRTGYGRDEVMGRSPRFLQGPKTDRASLDRIREAMRFGLPVQVEIINYTKAGGEFWLDLKIVPVKDPAGRITHFVAVERDITERKQAENLLQAKEQEQRLLARQLASEKARLLEAQSVAKVGSWETDLTSYTVTWSEETFRIFEISPDRFHPTHAGFLELVHPDDRTAVDQAFHFSIGQPGSFNIEHRLLMPDGRIKFVEERWKMFSDEQGRPMRVGGTCMDITDRKLAEAALRESEERFSGAFLQAPIGVALVSPGGSFLKVNRALCQMVGYSEVELLSRTFQDITHPDDLAVDLENVRQLLAREAGMYEMEKRYVHKDKYFVTVQLNVSLVRDNQGRPSYFISQLQDITQRKRLEEEFRQAQKMEGIGQLAGGVAHDFNNILAVIQLQSGLLKAEQSLSEKQLEMAGEIESSAQRAADLTRQLLLFSRKQPMQRRDLDMKAVVVNITRMLRRIVGEDIEMQFKFFPEPLLIHADAGMIDQILLNLTVNARDAMPDGGRLFIETSTAEFDEVAAAQSPQAKPGSFICLTVTDTGSGIPPEIIPKIFEPFFTTKDVGKGTGLGLATVFSIIQQHQGWINVYSEVGRGTTFHVYIPRQVMPSDQSAGWSSLATVRGGTETILLVEDDVSLRTSVRKALARLGYDVQVATNGPDALAIWEQQRDKIRLLLTDMVMPGGMNGKQLAQELLRQRPELKVVYTSGYIAEIAGKDLSLEEGVNFLNKPFEAHKLAHIIRNCLDES